MNEDDIRELQEIINNTSSNIDTDIWQEKSADSTNVKYLTIPDDMINTTINHFEAHFEGLVVSKINQLNGTFVPLFPSVGLIDGGNSDALNETFAAASEARNSPVNVLVSLQVLRSYLRLNKMVSSFPPMVVFPFVCSFVSGLHTNRYPYFLDIRCKPPHTDRRTIG